MDNQNNKNNPNNNRQGWGIILVTTLLVTFMVMGFYSLMRGDIFRSQYTIKSHGFTIFS